MKYFFSMLVLFMYSCTTDNEIENVNTDAQISGYKTTISSQSTDSGFPCVGQTIYNGVVQNGKLIEINQEFFLNEASQESNINSSFIYQNNLLVSHMDHVSSDGSPRALNFYYDSNSKLIGCTMIINDVELYYRFVHVSTNLVYFEKISLPYNNSSAVIEKRCIAVFEGDDIVQAGIDNNLDGVMESVNNFQYSYGNLVAATNATQSLSLNYSSVINNMNVLYDNSYGKKNRRIINIECFCFHDFEAVLGYSKNLTNDELSQATYDILPSNYYHLKTNSQTFGPPAVSFNGTSTKTTEFFFN